jgi:predicted ATPase
MSSIPQSLDELLTIEINALPPFTRDALIRASCIGCYFDMFIMKTSLLLACIDDEVTKQASFRRQTSLSDAISLAVDMNIVEEVGKLGYRFVHDSLWKAFYNMVPDESRELLHLEIGRVMKKRLHPSRREVPSGASMRNINVGVSDQEMNSFVNQYLFSTVDQLNRGKDLITSQPEVVELFMMNVKAAKLAALNSSWLTCRQYLENVIHTCEEDENWVFQYDMCLLVNTMYSEVNVNLGYFQTAKSMIDNILRNGKSIDDTCEFTFGNVFCFILISS